MSIECVQGTLISMDDTTRRKPYETPQLRTIDPNLAMALLVAAAVSGNAGAAQMLAVIRGNKGDAPQCGGKEPKKSTGATG